MKLFLSWGGPRSDQLGEFMKGWLENIFQNIDIFYSRDIDKGAKWFAEITGSLQECDLGIFLLTSVNFKSQWINFEAGAISKNLDRASVFTLIIDDSLDVKDLGPLSNYQATFVIESDIRKLLGSINNRFEDKKLNEHRLSATIEKWLPEFWRAWEYFRHIPLTDGAVDSRPTTEKVDDALRQITATYRNTKAVLDQCHDFVDVSNERLRTKLEKREPPKGKNIESKIWYLAETILPDGSKIRHSKLPHGGKFETWDGYKIAMGLSDEDLDKMLRSHGLRK